MPQLPSPQLIAPTVLPQVRVALLMDYVREGAADPRVAKIARSIVEGRARTIGRPLTSAEAAQALADAVHELVDYAPDPPGQEVFQSAITTLGNGCGRGTSPLSGTAKGCGDCEDLAVLLAAFCLAIGIRARVVWMEQPGAPLNHVSAQVCVDPAAPDCWQWLDATLPGARLGEHPYDALARVGDAFRARVFGTRPASGFWAEAVDEPDAPRTTLLVEGFPIDGRAEIDGAPVQGAVSGSDWSGGVPDGFLGPRRVTVVDQFGVRRSMPITFTQGQTSRVAYRGMPVDTDSRVVIVGMPHGGTVDVDGQPIEGGTWLDAGMTRWAVSVPAEFSGSLRTLGVTNPIGQRLTARITPPPGGTREVEYLVMSAVDPTPPGALPPPPYDGPRRVVIVGMPAGGTVTVDGRSASDGTWLDEGMTRWAAILPSDMGDINTVTVTAPSGERRSARALRNIRTQDIRYALMVPERAPPGSVVVIGMPPPGTGAPRVVIVGMPHGGTVTINGQTPPNATWLDGGYTRWAVDVPPGLAGTTGDVVVTAADGSRRSKRVTIAAMGDTEVDYAGMGSTPGTVMRAPRVVIVGMPHGGTVTINGQTPPNATWLDGGYTRWAVDVPPGLAGTTGDVVVTAADGSRRSRRVTIAAMGDTEVDYAGMTSLSNGGGAGGSAPTAPRVVIRGMPHGSIVQADGRVLSVGTWLDAERTRWAVSVPSDLVGHKVSLAVTSPEGERRQRAVELPVQGDTDIAYADMAPTEPAPRPEGRVVVRGAPADVEASIARFVEGAPTERIFLRPDPAGYLAATLPVGEWYRLSVRVNTGLGAQTFEAPVTIALHVDSVYDLTADGLVFRPQVTDARANPRPEGGVQAQSGRALLTVTGVPDDGNAPGAVAATGASTWVVEARLQPAMEGARLPGTPLPPPVPWTSLQKRSPGVYTGELSPGPADVRVYRRAGGRDGLDERWASVDLQFGPNTLDFNTMRATAPRVDVIPAGQGVVRVTGVPAGWSVSIAGNVVNGPITCENPDACSAPYTGGGTAIVTITRAGVQATRAVSLPEDRREVTVDMGFEARRAQTLAAGTMGVTGVDARGVRVGYWSDLALAQLRGLPDAAVRRTVKELERITAPGPDGRAIYALFTTPHGMMPFAATETQARRFARDLGILSAGRMTSDGRYPFEIVLPQSSTRGAT